MYYNNCYNNNIDSINNGESAYYFLPLRTLFSWAAEEKRTTYIVYVLFIIWFRRKFYFEKEILKYYFKMKWIKYKVNKKNTFQNKTSVSKNPDSVPNRSMSLYGLTFLPPVSAQFKRSLIID